MTRPFYALLLRLHPRSFRQRFAEEMLWIFDQQTALREQAPLLADAFLSLVRQWTVRSAYWEHPAVASGVGRRHDGVPVFYTFGSSAPASGALLNGVLLSIAAFGTVAFLIAHGKTTGLVELPRVVLPSLDIVPSALIATPRAPAGSEINRGRPVVGGHPVPQTSAPPADARSSVAPTRNPAGPASGARRAPQHSFALAGPRVGKPIAQKAPPDLLASQAALVMSLLDTNGDRQISRDERSSERAHRFRELLERADQNQDEVVTKEELLDALRARAF